MVLGRHLLALSESGDEDKDLLGFRLWGVRGSMYYIDPLIIGIVGTQHLGLFRYGFRVLGLGRKALHPISRGKRAIVSSGNVWGSGLVQA